MSKAKTKPTATGTSTLYWLCAPGSMTALPYERGKPLRYESDVPPVLIGTLDEPLGPTHCMLRFTEDREVAAEWLDSLQRGEKPSAGAPPPEPTAPDPDRALSGYAPDIVAVS
jgi:hypothetical protein